MSERMTVEEARLAFERDVEGERVNGYSTDAAFDRLRQAILDEGLKDERARVDGLLEVAERLQSIAVDAVGRIEKFGHECKNDECPCLIQSTARAIRDLAALADRLSNPCRPADIPMGQLLAAVNLLTPLVEVARAAEALRVDDVMMNDLLDREQMMAWEARVDDLRARLATLSSALSLALEDEAR